MHCDKLFAAPGNPGIAEYAECIALALTDHAIVARFCADHNIELVVIGPEAPLVDGLADTLRAAGRAVFGPSALAAQLEGSKGFTKDLCARAGIPTAAYRRFDDKAAAVAGLAQFRPPFVIKADGLAAGKGVVIAETLADARAALEDMFGGGFGHAGAAVVIEEFMEGEEVSFFALTDGTTIMPFGSAQDHKRVGEGDTGLNTGGMGAYSPARILTPALARRVMDEIIAPTVKALSIAGTPYNGVLFAGLMLTAEGPKLIEYNCRFGDPECQVLMMRLEGDFATLLLAVAKGHLATAPTAAFASDAALTVVIAANGYPAAPNIGGEIIITEVHSAKVFHAGTVRDVEGRLVAGGGRVLNVSATGPTVAAAQERAYAGVRAVSFPSGFYRSDIGWREIARETLSS